MKKMKLLMIISGLLIAGSLCAQNKIGYISLDNMVGIMPETAKADTLIQHFQVDSLQPRYTYTLSEYMRKDSIVNGKDSSKLRLLFVNRSAVKCKTALMNCKTGRLLLSRPWRINKANY